MNELQSTGGAASWAPRLFVSAVIVAVIGLQAQAVAGVRQLWPFTDYPMYRTAHYLGESIHRYRVVATLEDGREVDFSPRALGISFFQHQYGPVAALQVGEWSAVQAYADIYRARHGARVSRLRLEDHPAVLGRGGVVDGPITVVAELEASSGAGE